MEIETGVFEATLRRTNPGFSSPSKGPLLFILRLGAVVARDPQLALPGPALVARDASGRILTTTPGCPMRGFSTEAIGQVRLADQRTTERDKIGRGKKILEACVLHAEFPLLRLGEPLPIVIENSHVKSSGPSCHDLPDPPQPNNAQHLTGHIPPSA